MRTKFNFSRIFSVLVGHLCRLFRALATLQASIAVVMDFRLKSFAKIATPRSLSEYFRSRSSPAVCEEPNRTDRHFATHQLVMTTDSRA